MSKVLTKKIQTQLSNYFSSDSEMTKLETRRLKNMVLCILKSKSVFVNQIATSLRKSLKLKDVTKRLSVQYLKKDPVENVRLQHLKSVSCGVSRNKKHGRLCFYLLKVSFLRP